MLSAVTALLVAASGIVSAQSPFPDFTGDPFKKYELSANGINASFIPYGARLTNLYVYDKNGASQDVVVGYDEGSQYLEDTVSRITTSHSSSRIDY
jgi:aldose 1-epimerase